ncbi:Grx4 family monothiol glutaredoxin [Candidatus Nucleicultrix amoebiphila]|jgi:monothiol glutaredoxin|uniref:Glutaredoxin n=1 Tax=Candidatus Nucleicultrix amoebiphila FS5 TaxID=1414854 RepID=A0A1W6N6G7_9PROT|nr:Grx4 family monothiol glutaredoxin [Candidatus Nucleicultrix amoebiphila]ARN85443.1 glutaredoxin [Candidatus Nucleicultrix amoebiphila FS5]
MTQTLFDEIKQQIQDNDVVLYMKGTQKTPMCGFSGFVVQVLNKFKVPFLDVNILENQDMRQAIKDFTNWPTIPQLYIKGEFVGGADIVRDMLASGEFENLLKAKGILNI